MAEVVEEDQVTRLEVAARHVAAEVVLGHRVVGKRDAEVLVDVPREAGAVEAALGARAAVGVGDAEEQRGVGDEAGLASRDALGVLAVVDHRRGMHAARAAEGARERDEEEEGEAKTGRHLEGKAAERRMSANFGGGDNP
jgi:hypothetical protein